ncbi:hypothetical protein [Vibrio splendidus]|uniref:HlyD family secretion protein n=1 Tax=Vibrio splendidus TaxID=29497 RepID=A0A2N7JNT5_VIBSP|nr:hypothetical protein [Vibrio splendidus]PMM44170.1 hypothetical protein BCT54_05035 [Vibrio splendidus]
MEASNRNKKSIGRLQVKYPSYLNIDIDTPVKWGVIYCLSFIVIVLILFGAKLSPYIELQGRVYPKNIQSPFIADFNGFIKKIDKNQAETTVMYVSHNYDLEVDTLNRYQSEIEVINKKLELYKESDAIIDKLNKAESSRLRLNLIEVKRKISVMERMISSSEEIRKKTENLLSKNYASKIQLSEKETLLNEQKLELSNLFINKNLIEKSIKTHVLTSRNKKIDEKISVLEDVHKAGKLLLEQQSKVERLVAYFTFKNSDYISKNVFEGKRFQEGDIIVNNMSLNNIESYIETKIPAKDLLYLTERCLHIITDTIIPRRVTTACDFEISDINKTGTNSFLVRFDSTKHKLPLGTSVKVYLKLEPRNMLEKMVGGHV